MSTTSLLAEAQSANDAFTECKSSQALELLQSVRRQRENGEPHPVPVHSQQRTPPQALSLSCGACVLSVKCDGCCGYVYVHLQSMWVLSCV